MPRNNVELVRTAYAIFDRGDLGAMLELIHPDAISYTAAPLPDPAEHQGHAGFLQWVENWTSNFEQFRMEPQEFIDAGDSVIVRVLQQGVGVESGVPVSQTFWMVHTVRDGLFVRTGIHATEKQARETAGVAG